MLRSAARCLALWGLFVALVEAIADRQAEKQVGDVDVVAGKVQASASNEVKRTRNERKRGRRVLKKPTGDTTPATKEALTKEVLTKEVLPKEEEKVAKICSCSESCKGVRLREKSKNAAGSSEGNHADDVATTSLFQRKSTHSRGFKCVESSGGSSVESSVQNSGSGSDKGSACTSFCGEKCHVRIPEKPSSDYKCESEPSHLSLAQFKEVQRVKTGCPPPQPCHCHCNCPELIWVPPPPAALVPTPMPFISLVEENAGAASSRRTSEASEADSDRLLPGVALPAPGAPVNMFPPPPAPPLPPMPPDWRDEPCPESEPCNCYCHCKRPPGAPK